MEVAITNARRYNPQGMTDMNMTFPRSETDQPYVHSEQPANLPHSGRDPIYLFACHLEWRDHRDVSAYHELVAALDDFDPQIRCLAEMLLHRTSPNSTTHGTGSTERW